MRSELISEDVREYSKSLLEKAVRDVGLPQIEEPLFYPSVNSYEGHTEPIYVAIAYGHVGAVDQMSSFLRNDIRGLEKDIAAETKEEELIVLNIQLNLLQELLEANIGRVKEL